MIRLILALMVTAIAAGCTRDVPAPAMPPISAAGVGVAPQATPLVLQVGDFGSFDRDVSPVSYMCRMDTFRVRYAAAARDAVVAVFRAKYPALRLGEAAPGAPSASVSAATVDLRPRCLVTGEMKGQWVAEAMVTLRTVVTAPGRPPETLEARGRQEVRRDQILFPTGLEDAVAESLQSALQEALYDLVRHIGL